MENKLWRKLDNSAKIYPLSTGIEYNPIFRLSVILIEKIEIDILRKAVDLALLEYEVFKVRLREGFFWHYFEKNNKEPIVEIETDYPCKNIDTKENNDYLFKITYYKNKINIDVFHALTDGNGALEFFKEIIYKYLEIKNDTVLDKEEKSIITAKNAEDSYMENYNKNIKTKRSGKLAYTLKGKTIKSNGVEVNHYIIDVQQLKKISKEQGATISMYLTAMLVYSIYETNYKKYNGKKTIKICVPINLKKYFPSNSLSNFFSYMTTETDIKNYRSYTFKDILNLIKEDYKRNLSKEEIEKTMVANIKIANNPLLRFVPTILKQIFVRIGMMGIRRFTTMTFSNLGSIEIKEEFKKDVKEFWVLIAPESVERIKCSTCSFDNRLVVSFTRILEDESIENKFYSLLLENQIKTEIERNGG